MFFGKFSSGSPEYLVAFLGNIGPKYERTRHNAGFMAADAFEKSESVRMDRLRFKALTVICEAGGRKVFALKPQTFMNLSGDAIGPAAKFYRIPPERCIVVCDDMSLPAGKLRVRRSGSAGGHNGLKSVIAQLGTDAFPRVKIGVGIPPKGEDIIGWVVGSVPPDDMKAIEDAAPRAVSAVLEIIRSGVDSAMNKYNG